MFKPLRAVPVQAATLTRKEMMTTAPPVRRHHRSSPLCHARRMRSCSV